MYYQIAIYLIPTLIVLIVLVWLARRTIFSYMKDEQGDDSGGFTLGEVRELHKQGAISDEEFERVKAQLVEGLQAVTAREAERNKQQKSSSRPPGTGV